MTFEQSSFIDRPPAQVWAWLARPGAVHRLTPPWLPMSVVSESDNLRDGVAQLRVAGLPWSATHRPDGYIEGRQFVDELRSAPVSWITRWRHRHRVDLAHDGTVASGTAVSGTVVSDRVETNVPDALLRNTFGYRARVLAGDLDVHARWSTQQLTIAVTGASGLIGTQLTALLAGGGHRVLRLVRPGEQLLAGDRRWDPVTPAAGLLDGVDAVIHLAGVGIAGRFTERHKAAIRDSRVGPTRLLAAVAVDAGVRTFVSASAIGYYGADRGDDVLTETATAGTGFLAERVVAPWEHEARDATTGSATRAVQVRTGLVLTPRGGFLRPLLPLFRLGVGGRMASGLGWHSWIGIDDLLDIYLRATADSALSGPINAVAPNPVRNEEFAATLGRVLHRPSLIPTPMFGPRLLLGGEGVRELAVASQRVVPQVLLDAGHCFRHVDVESALRHLLGKVLRDN